LSPWTIWTML